MNYEAGKELNEAVAQKVMGWSLEYVDGDGTHIWYSHADDVFWPTPCFSTDIAWAMRVAEFLIDKGDGVVLARCRDIVVGDTGWRCQISRPGVAEWVASCSSAPLAICLASLKAVGK